MAQVETKDGELGEVGEQAAAMRARAVAAEAEASRLGEQVAGMESRLGLAQMEVQALRMQLQVRLWHAGAGMCLACRGRCVYDMQGQVRL